MVFWLALMSTFYIQPWAGRTGVEDGWCCVCVSHKHLACVKVAAAVNACGISRVAWYCCFGPLKASIQTELDVLHIDLYRPIRLLLIYQEGSKPSSMASVCSLLPFSWGLVYGKQLERDLFQRAGDTHNPCT